MQLRRALLAAALVGTGLLVAPVSPVASVAAPSTSDVAAACAESPVPVVGGVDAKAPACRGVTAAGWGLAAGCRTPLRATGDPAAPETCAAIDGRPVSDARLATFRSSWAFGALARQRALDADVPLTEATIVHTHNSANTSAYDGATGNHATLTNQDPNQAYSLRDQLDMGVRFLELDLHWMPSPFGTAATGGRWVTLCHGNSGNPLKVHVGCTTDRRLEDGLREVRAWMDANPAEVVFLYLENQLDGDALAHETASAILSQELDGLVDTHYAQPCAPMDWSRSRTSIAATGARVVLVGNCGARIGNDWGGLVWERGPRWDESGRPDGYSLTSSACAADRAARDGGPVFRRYFEDQTWVGAGAGSNPYSSSVGSNKRLDATAAAAMARCGVNIAGFDQLLPDDGRLEALVWSWAPGEPVATATSACAFQGTDGRFHDDTCTTPRRVACTSGPGSWAVTPTAVAWSSAASACTTTFPGSTFGVPRNGYRNDQLSAAKPSPSTEVWLAYRATPAGWSPTTV